MRRLLALLAVLVTATLAGAAPAAAGSPHFIKSAMSYSISGDTLTVSGKEAGLGDEEQIHVVVSALAECVNRGGNKPSADNKDAFSAAGDFPVQNGKADFTLSVTATFQPNCSPPMSVVWSDIRVTDTTNGLVWTF